MAASGHRVSMTSKKFAFSLFGLLLYVLGASSLYANDPGRQMEAIMSSNPRIPSYLTIEVNPSTPTMIAGEVDSFYLEIRLDTIAVEERGLKFWKSDSAVSVIAWLSAPRGSGITFVDAGDHHNIGNQTMIRLKSRKDEDPNVLSSGVRYHVESGVKTGGYAIVLDILAELVGREGNRLQDAGVVRIPVEIDTHLTKKILMLAVVALAIFLFVVEWVRVDVVAILMMILLPELGLLNSGDAFRGLSSNAVIAIIGVMIISFGLNRTGLVNMAIQPLLKYVKSGATSLVVIFSSMIALISSVVQNTGAAVLFLPAIRKIASKELGISISRVLMPIGMAAILGGTLTMIGTSPLILLNDILPKGMEKFSLLELTPIGFALVLGGVLYLSTAGMKILSNMSDGKDTNNGPYSNPDQRHGIGLYRGIEGPFEIFVPNFYRPQGTPRGIASIRRYLEVNIVAVASDNGFVDIAPHPKSIIQRGTALCVYGSRKNVRLFVKDYGLVLKDEPNYFKKDLFNPSYTGTVEMVISPRSSFIGRTIKDIRFRETYAINALALHQDGRVYYKELADRILKSGDVILVHGTWEQILLLKENHQNFIIMSPSDIEAHNPHKARPAFISFMLALVLMLISSFYFQKLSYNPLPISLCLMAGAIGMVLSKVMTISEAYRAIDWRTVFLLAGLIPLGMAVDQTGTAHWLANGIVVGLGDYMSPLLLLVVLAVLSCLFTMVVSNVGACALLIPLGIAIATQIGLNPRIAAIVVGIGVSNSFLLPTHQVNALYMGPGNYKTKDYIKIGGGLSLIYIAILVSVTFFLYV